VPGPDAGYGTEKQDHEDEGDNAESNDLEQIAAGAPGVDDSSASRIKYGHGCSPAGIVGIPGWADK
jgi:hypothetical protein